MPTHTIDIDLWLQDALLSLLRDRTQERLAKEWGISPHDVWLDVTVRYGCIRIDARGGGQYNDDHSDSTSYTIREALALFLAEG